MASCDSGSSDDDRIDELCDSFELEWRNGRRPRIRDFVGAGDESFRKKLFRELLLVELERRRDSGEQPAQADYLRDFPEFASQIDAIGLQFGEAAFSVPLVQAGGTERGKVKGVGSRIAHFELIKRLGSGAMGEAWKAWDVRLKRFVTIKFPHSHFVAENELKRFLREAEAAAQLSHPQLACVHEAGSDGGTLYIAATFVEGVNLREYAASKQLAVEEIVVLCASAGEALQHAHKQGVVHRDLKPANIIVDPNGLPHIIDFGLAKFQDAEHDLTLHGEVLGTPAYMSPELAGGDAANVGAKTDIYSLGGNSVRAADWATAVRRWSRFNNHADRGLRSAGSSFLESRDFSRPRDDLLEGNGEDAGKPVRVGSRNGGRPSTLFRGKADTRSTCGNCRKGMARRPSTSHNHAIDFGAIERCGLDLDYDQFAPKSEQATCWSSARVYHDDTRGRQCSPDPD